MFIKKEIGQEEIILDISGSLSDNSTAEFESYLNDIIEGIHQIITLKMAEVDSINSACLGKILRINQLLRTQNRLFRIVGCSDLLYAAFRKLKVDKLIRIIRNADAIKQ